MPYIDISISKAQEIDEQLANADPYEALSPTMFQWSKTVRAAIGLPMTALANRMGISQPAVTKLERSEAMGTISIERLTALADALGCDLVYGFIPRKPLTDTSQALIDAQDKARKAKRKIPRGK